MIMLELDYSFEFGAFVLTTAAAAAIAARKYNSRYLIDYRLVRSSDDITSSVHVCGSCICTGTSRFICTGNKVNRIKYS